MKTLLLVTILASTTSHAQTFESEGQKLKTEVIVSKRDDSIWGFDWLRDGRMIFTERKGALNIFDPKTKQVIKIKNVPSVKAEGQGGLLDVRVHPSNEKIFITYSEPVGKNNATTAIASATLSGDSLTDFKKLWSATPALSSEIHYGSRIVFDGKGHVIFTVGERGERDNAQNPSYTTGKVIRLKEDGSIPSDNPMKDGVYALGIRSPQGLAFHPESGELWEAEMGPRGGDEINVIEPGKNYGWPVITYGREYWGPKIGEEKKEGMEQPIVHWVPSISPSGMAFYTGDKIAKWKDNIFLACLSGVQIRRVVFDGKRVVKQEKLLEGTDRYRNVRTGPDGYLYYSTDTGSIGRLVLAN